MYTTELATLINEAVNDCILYGSGWRGRWTIDIYAEWAENETDIVITVKENRIIRFTFTEEIPEEYR